MDLDLILGFPFSSPNLPGAISECRVECDPKTNKSQKDIYTHINIGVNRGKGSKQRIDGGGDFHCVMH